MWLHITYGEYREVGDTLIADIGIAPLVAGPRAVLPIERARQRRYPATDSRRTAGRAERGTALRVRAEHAPYPCAWVGP